MRNSGAPLLGKHLLMLSLCVGPKSDSLPLSVSLPLECRALRLTPLAVKDWVFCKLPVLVERCDWRNS